MAVENALHARALERDARLVTERASIATLAVERASIVTLAVEQANIVRTATEQEIVRVMKADAKNVMEIKK